MNAPEKPRTPGKALGLYVHLPWCVRKCPYCDFNSHALKAGSKGWLDGELPEAEYVRALLADLDQDIAEPGPVTVNSIFLGGGTPSLFSPSSIEALLSGVRDRLKVTADAEITMEANPGTVEQSRFAGFRAAGVNRLSLGIQSFDDDKLRALGRIHDAGQCRVAIEAARAAGFDNLNLDVMFALPEQGVEQATEDVRIALSYEPEHLSHYQLTLEPNTLFYARPPPLPDDDSAWAMQQSAVDLLAGAGLHPYEVSAWARVGRECRHNLNYWRFGDYLGIGAGAHGKLTHGGRVVRTAKQRHPAVYMARSKEAGRIQHTRRLAPDDLIFEFMLNRLRLAEGWTDGEFRAATGVDTSAIAAPLDQARDLGLMEFDGSHWRPTGRGRRFLNDLQGLFLPAPRETGGVLAGGAGLP
jgi:putative oxygen-independent coproporphyrinogen III oxidase